MIARPGGGRRASWLVLVAAALRLTTAHATEDGSEEIPGLENGGIVVEARDVPGRPLPRMKAMGVVDAPPARVWAVIDDCSAYDTWMPWTRDSRELSRTAEGVLCRQTVDMPFPLDDLLSETNAINTVKPGETYRREWTHHGGDFVVNDGSWTLLPRAGGRRTLAIYEALSEPTIPIPGFILRIAQKSTLPSLIERLREKVR